VDSPLLTPGRHRLSRPHRRGGAQDSRAPRPLTSVSAAANGRRLRGTGGPQAGHLAGRAGLALRAGGRNCRAAAGEDPAAPTVCRMPWRSKARACP
jgi:hypothetical protein